MFWYTGQRYNFMSFIQGTSWTGLPRKVIQKSSYDNGRSWKEEEGTQLFGSYFFMTDEILTHEYTAYNIVNLAG